MIFRNLSYFSQSVFKPIFVFGLDVKNGIDANLAFLNSKKKLKQENLVLMDEIQKQKILILNSEILKQENEELKSILNRKKENQNLLLANIISKKSFLFYDNLLLDVGEKDGVFVGDMVFAYSDVALGKVIETTNSTSKISLFSTPNEKIEAYIYPNQNSFEIIGRGRGNFELVLPRDFEFIEDSKVILPGINSYLLAYTKKVISDPRDSFKKILLSSPVNVYNLNYVQVEIKR